MIDVMAVKYIILFSACIVLALTQDSGLQTVNGRIKITVGTTAGCSDTVNFINNQLIPTVEAYGDFLDIEFVPWGRATWVDNEISCQFGVNDCWANRLHRCVLDKLKNDQAAQLHYMACEFSTPYPSYLQGTYLCVQAFGLNLLDVDYCVANPKDNLDREALEGAVQPIATINFVPYIIFNDNLNLELHREGFSRLASLVCFALTEDPSTGVTSCSI
ncbi:GILT-like protein 3 [Spodoptera litura]|uniref:GILT-like protein 3 n=1 Tax=Spodoptera litura TaxID=69820 RepID=A0A9J7EGH6_SPOLT|nr:GILT-like protein 3 [Spodoptera litura]